MTNIKKGLLVKNENGKKARFMVFSTMKGGVLKTSSTVNTVGAILRDNPNAKILVVDFDMQGNVSTSFNMDADSIETTLTNVLLDEAKAEDAIYEMYRPQEGNGFIYVLPSNYDAASVEMEIIGNPEKYPNPMKRFNDTCGHLVDYFDYIVCDTPPSYSLNISMVFNYTSAPEVEIYVPFHPETYSYKALLAVVKSVKIFKEQHNPNLNIKGIFSTKVDKKTNIHALLMRQAREYCNAEKIPMLRTYITQSIRSENSIAYEGVPSTLSTNKNDLVVSYLHLWEEIK